MTYVAKRVNQKGTVYTDTYDYPNTASAWSVVTHTDPTRPTKSQLVATRVFRPEDGLNYAATLTTATVTV